MFTSANVTDNSRVVERLYLALATIDYSICSFTVSALVYPKVSIYIRLSHLVSRPGMLEHTRCDAQAYYSG